MLAAPASPPTSDLQRARLSARGSVNFLALAAGLGVANLYYAQPLAAMIAESLRVTAGAFGFALMMSQIGYALGLLFLVPLGDGRERRGLMVKTAAAASGTLLLVAIAPNFPLLVAASLLLGFASSLPQMAVPFAVGLVGEAGRGRAIGTVMGGLLAGILLSRTASGALASAAGWRATFACAAVVMAATSIAIRWALPLQRPAQPLSWSKILVSLAQVAKSQPVLRRQALVGAAGFASFSVFWSTLSYHLARLGHGSKAAGLFGAVGVVGVVVAPLVGRFAGRVRPTRINVVALCAVVASFGVMWLAKSSLIGIALGVVLLDAGVQASHLTNQTIVYGLEPELRNRLNSVYMVTYFVGGSLGTVAAAFAWERAGWGGVCVLGAALAGSGVLPLLRRPASLRL